MTGPIISSRRTLLKAAALVAGTAAGTSQGACRSPTAVTPAAVTAPAFGLLTVSGNQILAPNGRRRDLRGSHTWTNRVDIATRAGQGAYRTGANNGQAFDFNAYLKVLANQGATCMRSWAWESTIDGGGVYGVVSPRPYAASGRKYDLSRINPAYTSRLVSRVRAASAHNIYTMVMLFDGASVNGSGTSFTINNPWATNPYNSANNINGVNGDPNNTGAGFYSHQQTSGPIWTYQTGYVAALMQALKKEEGVIWEVCNESATDSATLAWQVAMVNFIHRWEASHGALQHLVCISAPADANSNGSELNSWMQRSPADLYTPSGAGGLYQRGNIPAPPSNKPCVPDTDHIYGVGGHAPWVWDIFMAGYSGNLYMDDMQGSSPTIAGLLIPGGSGNEATEVSARTGMAQVNYVSALVDLTGCAPSSAAGGFACLANPSTGTYIVYAPSGGTPALNLTGSRGRLGYRWYDLSGDGNLTTFARIARNGGAVSLPCPSSAGVLIVQPATVTHAGASSAAPL